MSDFDGNQAKENALRDLQKIKEELLKRERSSIKNHTNKPITKLKCLEKKAKHKKHKSHKKHKKSEKEKDKHRSERRRSSSSSSDSSEEEVSKPKKRSCSPEVQKRDEWMTESVLVKTYSKDKPQTKKQCTTYETYEPGKSARELNPHWKNGGMGLPSSFMKPKEDDDEDVIDSIKYSSKGYKKGDWVKKSNKTNVSHEEVDKSESVSKEEEPLEEFLSDQQMNELAAKIMKAELLNNTELASQLKKQLNTTRLAREKNPKKSEYKPKNKYQTKSHTEVSHRRHRAPRNLPPEYEEDFNNKFETSSSQRRGQDMEEKSEKDKEREIREEARHSKRLNHCERCINSDRMDKEFVVSMGKRAYVALPRHEGLQLNHCLIVPIDHFSCSTDLDEDVWQEISNYRRVLTKIFAKRKQDVLFFETARYLQKRRHMVIQCVPSDGFEMAQFYFKKAIEESEYEWSKNKQLVILKEKNLRKSIPCGLPYFWVHFGMDFGFAHVIENQEMFPIHFAEEIIGGMLTLDMRKWRAPREEYNVRTKVKNLADLLKPYESEIC